MADRFELRLLRLFVFFGRSDLNFRFLQDLGVELEQLERTGGGDALAVGQAVVDLRHAAVADADLNLPQVRLVVVVDDDGVGRALRAGEHRLRRDDERVGHRLRDHLDLDAGAGTQLAVGIVGLDPDFDGRVRRVDGRADLRHLRVNRRALRSDQVRRVADLQLRRLRLRDVRARGDLRDVHHRDDGLSARRRLARVVRQIGDDAVDRAGDPRIRELRLRRLVVPLRLRALRARGFQLLVAREALQVIGLLAGGLVRAAGLAERGLGVVDVLLRHGALAEQARAVVEDGLRGIERVLRGFRVELRLLLFLRNRGPRRRLIRRFGEIERRVALGGGAGEVRVLELEEQLPRADLRAALDVVALDGRGDLGNDGRLLPRIQQPVGADRPLDLRQQHRRDVDRHDRRLLFFLAAMARGRGEQREDDDEVLHQKLPVTVCSSASARRYRAPASSTALRVWTSVFCASTTSSAVDSPAW